jgi:hypothetical protein
VAVALLGLLGAPAVRPAHADDAPNVEDMVDAINGVFGSHQGYRAVHAKGFCAAGSFEPTPEAKGVSRAVIFDGRAASLGRRQSTGKGTGLAARELVRGRPRKNRQALDLHHDLSRLEARLRRLIPRRVPGHEDRHIGTRTTNLERVRAAADLIAGAGGRLATPAEVRDATRGQGS